MEFFRNGAGRIRLLPGLAEVADEYRPGWVAQVEDLRHAPGSPCGQAGDEIGDAGIAFPEILVRALEAADLAQALWRARVGHIPHLVRGITEHAEHVELVRITFGQTFAGADAYHLRAAGLVDAFLAGNMVQILRRPRVGE